MSGRKPICPSCGSIKVRVDKKTGQCLEADCGHAAPAPAFRGYGPGTTRDRTNQHWRDGAALSLDGQEGNR